jgi:hypothetical protein
VIEPVEIAAPDYRGLDKLDHRMRSPPTTGLPVIEFVEIAAGTMQSLPQWLAGAMAMR